MVFCLFKQSVSSLNLGAAFSIFHIFQNLRSLVSTINNWPLPELLWAPENGPSKQQGSNKSSGDLEMYFLYLEPRLLRCCSFANLKQLKNCSRLGARSLTYFSFNAIDHEVLLQFGVSYNFSSSSSKWRMWWSTLYFLTALKPSQMYVHVFHSSSVYV